MRQELREKILAYNQSVAKCKEKAGDLEIILSELMKLPHGQLKKVLTEEIVEILEKYGFALLA